MHSKENGLRKHETVGEISANDEKTVFIEKYDSGLKAGKPGSSRLEKKYDFTDSPRR